MRLAGIRRREVRATFQQGDLLPDLEDLGVLGPMLFGKPGLRRLELDQSLLLELRPAVPSGKPRWPSGGQARVRPDGSWSTSPWASLASISGLICSQARPSSASRSFSRVFANRRDGSLACRAVRFVSLRLSRACL